MPFLFCIHLLHISDAFVTALHVPSYMYTGADKDSIYIYTHIYTHIYIYICVCVCVCIWCPPPHGPTVFAFQVRDVEHDIPTLDIQG